MKIFPKFFKASTSHFVFTLLCALCTVLTPLSVSHAQSEGDLDLTFSGDGKLLSDPTGNNEYINDVAIQSDGKIVVAGYVDYGTYTDFLVARFNTDGTPDTGFGVGGYVTKNFNPPGDDTRYNDKAYAVGIDLLGNIIVAGSSDVNDINADPHFAITKYHPSGELDVSFGDMGIVVTPIGLYSEARDIVVVDDINFLVAGYAFIAETGKDFVLVKYEVNGILEAGFGSGLCGAMMISVTCLDLGNSLDDEANALTVQHDGKIVLAGQTLQTSTAPQTNVAMARFDSNGLLDSSFGSNGRIVTDTADIGAASTAAQDVVVDPSGNVVVTGHVGTSINIDVFLVRYNSSGTPDNSFDGDGIVTSDWGTTKDYAHSLGIDRNGNILVAGKSQNKFAVARYLSSNGRPDFSFGTNGVVTTLIMGDASAQALAIDANGKIVLAGQDRAINTKIALARYLGILTDADGDGFYAQEDDCDDTNRDINPSAKEICGDGIDQDCNGSDLACPSIRPRIRFFRR